MYKLSVFKKMMAGLLAASLLVGFFCFAPAGVVAAAASAQAQSGNPPQETDQTTAVPRLEARYQNELKVVTRQGVWVARTQKIVDRVNQQIDRLLGKGKNVQPLKDALAEFGTGVAESKADHDRGAATLSVHAGFDAFGKVIDRQLAQETVNSAGRDLKQAATTYRQSAAELRRAIRAYLRQK